MGPTVPAFPPKFFLTLSPCNFSPCVATLQLGRYLFNVIFLCGIYLRALAFFLTYDTFFTFGHLPDTPSYRQYIWLDCRQCSALEPIFDSPCFPENPPHLPLHTF